ncbi:MAG: hypothetical protein QF886_21960 [Planctomycetota bacterium]|jgi:hypothetical protein|nr:hypothetical protein [Planctomycetota bacterium]
MTTNLPHYGGIALRNRGKKNYCYLHYGRELVHGHPNKLSINAYAKGGWFVRNVMGGYGDNFKNFLNTIASSTSIMVDGRNPDADTGELLFHKSGDGWDAASAREVGAYKDVEHERSMVLAGDLLIVLDRCVSETEHTYDWLYHTSLTRLSLDGALKEVETKRPGGSQLYESFVPIGDVSKRSAVTFKRQDGSGVRIAFLNGDEIHAFKALKKYDGLLWRKKGKTLSFAAVYWPFRPDEKGEVSIAALPLKDTGIAQGQAVKVNSPEGKFVVLVNYGGKELQCDTFRSKERVSVFRAP